MHSARGWRQALLPICRPMLMLLSDAAAPVRASILTQTVALASLLAISTSNEASDSSTPVTEVARFGTDLAAALVEADAQAGLDWRSQVLVLLALPACIQVST